MSKEPESKAAESESSIQAPPTGVLSTLVRIGPGLIIAGSIVGSGELIGTTITGAKAGFWLLWLMIIGCVIKVFVQVELGRYAVSSGESSLVAMDRVPGPRLGKRGNWVIWYWFIMFIASVAQLGGIVGGVGQALSISLPLTEQGREYDEFARRDTRIQVNLAELAPLLKDELLGQVALNDERIEKTRVILESYADLARMMGERLEDEHSREANLSSVADEAYLASRVSYSQMERGCTELLLQLPAGDGAGPTGAATVSEKDLRAIQQQLVAWGEWKRLRDDRLGQEARIKRAPERRLPELQERLAKAQAAESAASEAAKEFDSAWEMTFAQPTEAHERLRADLDRIPRSHDDKIWAGIIALITSLILMKGRFGLILSFSTAMVACFTAVTIINLVVLQRHEGWAVSMNDVIDGLKFRLPPSAPEDRWAAVSTALKTFGIIGVGATELVAYPYWCLEKGYARFTGPRDDTAGWAERAKGWIRVMWVDAWGSMLVYTFATIAFYLLGASVLGRSGIVPSEHSLIRYLTVMFAPVFGPGARLMFLFGVFAVLYSTLFVASAGHARVFADALRVVRLIPASSRAYKIAVVALSGLFPLICLAIYVAIPMPTFLVLLSGLMQLIMLPMLAATALYLRYTHLDGRLRPSWFSDAGLWLSTIGMLIAGVAGAWLAGSELLKLW